MPHTCLVASQTTRKVKVRKLTRKTIMRKRKLTLKPQVKVSELNLMPLVKVRKLNLKPIVRKKKLTLKPQVKVKKLTLNTIMRKIVKVITPRLFLGVGRGSVVGSTTPPARGLATDTTKLKVKAATPCRSGVATLVGKLRSLGKLVRKLRSPGRM